jgi:hypothetical protein
VDRKVIRREVRCMMRSRRKVATYKSMKIIDFSEFDVIEIKL